ncbi:MAG TPA: DUF1349 domain-containing protein [Chitinophagaceae bacterium]|nr:DUF1349 domain-containing protein [Chitinophagaceae bacterium]
MKPHFNLPQLLILLALLFPFTNCRAQETDTTVTLQAIPAPLIWENHYLQFVNNQSSFTVTAPGNTDMFRNPNVTYNTDNAPKLLFTPDSNFVLTACIQHSFTSKWDGGAIVLKADNLNWIKFCFEKDYTGQHRVVSVVTNNISDDCNSVAIAGNSVYYKMAKAGNVITLYYALDGQHWFLVRHLQFNAQGPLQLGFLAQSPTGKSSTVTFSHITYQAKKISDPYTGE